MCQRHSIALAVTLIFILSTAHAQDLIPGDDGPMCDTACPAGPAGPAGADGEDGADGKSAYEIAVDNGFRGNEASWLDSLKGNDGVDGEVGPAGADGVAGPMGPSGADGVDGKDGAVGPVGPAGADGVDGTDGAVGPMGPAGPPGSGDGSGGADGEDGVDGKSAYEIAVENGFRGDEASWLDSLKGVDGKDGAVGPMGPAGPPGSGDGSGGADGEDGVDGKSAYEIAVENGFRGSEVIWLNSLKGADGEAGPAGAKGMTGAAGADGVDGKDGAIGPMGPAGPPGTGDGSGGADGEDGVDGKSAYELAVENGFKGSEANWLSSLKGADGEAGPAGADGVDGQDGAIGPVGPAGPQGPPGVGGLSNSRTSIADQLLDELGCGFNDLIRSTVNGWECVDASDFLKSPFSQVSDYLGQQALVDSFPANALSEMACSSGDEGSLQFVSALGTFEGIAFLGTDNISSLSTYDIAFKSESNVGIAGIVGSNATIEVSTASSSSSFSGIVASAGLIATENGEFVYAARLQPALSTLPENSDYRVYQNVSVSDIIQSVLSDSGISDYEMQITGNYSAREYVVQYDESDFEFISRLMEEEGFHYYFRPDGTMVISDSSAANGSVPTSGSFVNTQRMSGALGGNSRIATGNGDSAAYRSGLIANNSLVTQVKHIAAVNPVDDCVTYANTFVTEANNGSYSPPKVTPKPRALGPTTAIVVGPNTNEIFWSDEFGRVLVQFQWDLYGTSDENSGTWLRVMMPAGRTYETEFYIPRKGTEVVVDFLDGDPDRPIVMGSVFNSNDMPRRELPDNLPKLQSRGGTLPD